MPQFHHFEMYHHKSRVATVTKQYALFKKVCPAFLSTPPKPSSQHSIHSRTCHIDQSLAPRPPPLLHTTYCLNSLTKGSQIIAGVTPFCFGNSTLHLYCTNSLSAQSDSLTGGFRAFPFGRVLICDSRVLSECMGRGGGIALELSRKGNGCAGGMCI
jgi:hypothetical protein